MSKRKKVLVWAGISAGTAVIILIALFAAAQYLLRSDAVRGRIIAEISLILSGKVDYSAMEINFFPRPGLVFRDFSMSRPEAVCTIPTLAVYPGTMPLLRGSLELDKVELGEPDCSINLPRDNGAAPLFSFEELDGKAARVAEALPAGLTLSIEKGKVRVSESGGGAFTCRDLSLKTSFAYKRLDVDFQGITAEWGRVSLGGRISYDASSISIERLSGRLAGSSLSGVDARISLGEAPGIELQTGEAVLVLDEIYPWLVSRGWVIKEARLKNLSGVLRVKSLQLEGPLRKPDEWRYAANGGFDGLRIESGALPQPLLIREGGFNVTPDEFALRGVKADLLDTSAEVSGKIGVRNFDIQSASFEVSGKSGKNTIDWISEFVPIPEEVRIPPRFSVSRASFDWKQGGFYSVQGTFILRTGTSLVIDLARTPAELNIRRLAIKDSRSDAAFSLRSAGGAAEATFRGVLHSETADVLFASEQPAGARIEGNLSARIFPGKLLRSTARGYLRASNIIIPLESTPPFRAHSISLKAAEDQFSVESADISWGEQRFTAGGAFKTSADGVVLDLDISAGWIELDRLLDYIMGEKEKDADKPDGKKPWPLPLHGVLRVSSDRLDYGQLIAQPFSADVSISPQRIGMEFPRLFICGQAAPGRIVITPLGISMNFRSVSVNQEVEPFLTCFLRKEAGLTGRFDLNLEVTGHLKYPESLRGTAGLVMRDGRIFHFELLSRILQFINITQVFVGRVPDLEKEGLPYDRISLEGRIEGGRLLLKEFLLEGPTLRLAGQGYVDFIEEDMDLSMLVSPLRAADYIIGKIPVVRYLMGGTFIAVPVGAYGHWNDPFIVPLDPSVLGQSIMDVFRRVFKIPIKVLEPLRSLESPPASTEGSPGPEQP
ncbi:MAG: AsmA-like C-terminal domain-containing protein [Syntrophales bacterium]|nr:AsmA-like C-terminal domain-containing protein [Syntrophales bacterium]